MKRFAVLLIALTFAAPIAAADGGACIDPDGDVGSCIDPNGCA